MPTAATSDRHVPGVCLRLRVDRVTSLYPTDTLRLIKVIADDHTVISMAVGVTRRASEMICPRLAIDPSDRPLAMGSETVCLSWPLHPPVGPTSRRFWLKTAHGFREPARKNSLITIGFPSADAVAIMSQLIDMRLRLPLPSKEETGNACIALFRQIGSRSLIDGDFRLFGRAVKEVDVVQQPTDFGSELRRRRLEADMTLTGLAKRVHYSKAQLSKVERGIKKPSRELARLCDAALAAEGALASLVLETPSGVGVTVDANGDEEVWLMQLSSRGQSRFQPMSRRQAVAAGAASIAGVSIGLPAISANVEDTTLIGTFHALFDQYRQLGQTTSPGLLLPVLIAQTHALQELSKTTGTRTRRALLLLGSRYAEYVGWLVQETGDERGALWWTRRAVDLADAGGDHHLAAYSLVRRALVTLYRGDHEQTIGLARQAQSGDVSPRIRGLAAQREAQGHALAGEYHACMQSLEQARALLARPEEGSGAPVIGTMNLTDPAEMVRGWCLYDLGRPRTAAQIIETQLAQVPEQAMRTRVRFGLRQALAHAADGEIDHACGLTRDLLPGVTTIGSATVATDLRALARTLSRHPKNRSVRALAPELGTALGTTIHR